MSEQKNFHLSSVKQSGHMSATAINLRNVTYAQFTKTKDGEWNATVRFIGQTAELELGTDDAETLYDSINDG